MITPISRTPRGCTESKTTAMALVTHSRSLAIRVSLSRAQDLRLGEYFARLVTIACVSGLSSRMIKSVPNWMGAWFYQRVWDQRNCMGCVYRRSVSCSARPNDGDRLGRSCLRRRGRFPGYYPDRTSKLDCGDHSQPLYPRFYQYDHFSTGCFDFVSRHCAHALEFVCCSTCFPI